SCLLRRLAGDSKKRKTLTPKLVRLRYHPLPPPPLLEGHVASSVRGGNGKISGPGKPVCGGLQCPSRACALPTGKILGDGHCATPICKGQGGINGASWTGRYE